MNYKLTEQEIKNSLLINDKQRFIDKLKPTMLNTEEYERISAFFKSHANLENKIDWQKTDKDPHGVYQAILELMKNTSEKKQAKQDIKSLFKSDEFEILGEDDDYIYVAPLTWEACVFIDSFKCGGRGATWCIGWEKSDQYWNNYTDDGDVFVLMMKKSNSRASIMEQLRMSGNIDDEKVYDLDNYDYEGVDYPDEKYPEDNKVMLQIDSSGYVTAWEQEDDFPLFSNQSVSRIIRECELGFEWDEMEYDRISGLIAEKKYGNIVDGIVIDNGDYVTIDYDEYNDSSVTSDDVNYYLSDRYDNGYYYKLVGHVLSLSTLGDMLENISISTLNMSELEVEDNITYELRDLFGQIYDVTDTLDLSCFAANNVICDNFFDGLYSYPQTVIVNPNCTVLIDYLNECNEKGAGMKIEMKYDYTNQPELDFRD